MSVNKSKALVKTFDWSILPLLRSVIQRVVKRKKKNGLMYDFEDEGKI